MSFTAIFIALLIERFFDCSHLRYWGWLARYEAWLAGKLSHQSPYIVLAAAILPLVIIVMVIALLLDNVLFGFLKLAFSILLILYCFGPRNLWADMFACLNAIGEGDTTSAAEKLKVTFGIMPSKPQEMHHQWLNAIFIQANRRVFAAIIWFSILGLPGIVLYRLISLLASDPFKENTDPQISHTASLIESYLDWPAVRALTFIFALGGNFGRVFTCWRKRVLSGVEANESLLVECGTLALNTTEMTDGSAEKEEISLLDRSFGIVLVVIAVLVFLVP